MVGHSESVRGTATRAPATGFGRALFVIIGSHEWLAYLRFAVPVSDQARARKLPTMLLTTAKTN